MTQQFKEVDINCPSLCPPFCLLYLPSNAFIEQKQAKVRPGTHMLKTGARTLQKWVTEKEREFSGRDKSKTGARKGQKWVTTKENRVFMGKRYVRKWGKESKKIGSKQEKHEFSGKKYMSKTEARTWQKWVKTKKKIKSLFDFYLQLNTGCEMN